jgi:hypothetical protein
MNAADQRKPEWFHRYSPRNGGDLSAESAALHEAILSQWAEDRSKAEIAHGLQISVGMVRKVVRNARLNQDPRGFAKTKPMLTMGANHTGVLDLYKEQWIIRGLSQRLDVHFTKIEQALREISKEIEGEACE